MSRHSSPLDSENCRSCTTFADYVKVARQKAFGGGDGKISESTAASTTAGPTPPDCPLDRNELGKSTWGLLHTIASKYPDNPTREEEKDVSNFLDILSRLYPCDYCAKDFRRELKSDPPKTCSYQDFSQWLCRIHNKVNLKIGKEPFDCSKVDERWRDGWRDGSCD